jgi:hypothetical protein
VTNPAKLPVWALIVSGMIFAVPIMIMIVVLSDWSNGAKLAACVIAAAVLVTSSLLGTYLRRRGVLPPLKSLR